MSLLIGANDLFLCQKQTSDACNATSEQAATAKKVAANVRRTLSAIRHRAGYSGQIVLVDYYSLDYASSVVSGYSTVINQANTTAARPFGVRVANAFRAFDLASVHSGDDTCTAGLLTQLGSPGSCGVHPSYAGQALLAATVEQAVARR